GNEMRADQAVGRRPADREGTPEPPEIAVAERHPEGYQRGLRGRRSGRAPGYHIAPRAVGGAPQGRGRATQKECDEAYRSQMTTPRATTEPPDCQRRAATTMASSGRKTSRPVELAAPSSPMASPRCVVNQRFTTVALSTRAVLPVPTPTTTPQRRYRWSTVWICVAAATPAASRSRLVSITRRGPTRSISRPAKGPARP